MNVSKFCILLSIMSSSAYSAGISEKLSPNTKIERSESRAIKDYTKMVRQNFDKKNIIKDKAIGYNCESVSEETAICDGNLYKRVKSTTDSLKRDVKRIEDYSDKNITAPAKSAVSK